MDFNQLHFVDSISKEFGFKGRISNGFVAESRIASALVNTFGSEDSYVLAMKKEVKYKKPVYMNDNITAYVKVVGRVPAIKGLVIEAYCVNQNSDKVITAKFYIRLFEK